MKKLLSLVAVLGLSVAGLTACSNTDTAADAVAEAVAISISEPVVRATDEMSTKNEATGKYMTASFMTIANSSDEDIMILSWLSNIAPEAVKFGMKVEVTFERMSDEISLHRFKPVH